MVFHGFCARLSGLGCQAHWGKALPVMQVWQASEGFQPSRRGFGWEDLDSKKDSKVITELQELTDQM
jgi:hypothetical protein